MDALRLINGNNHNSNKTANGTHSATPLSTSGLAKLGLVYENNNANSKLPDARSGQLDSGLCLKLLANQLDDCYPPASAKDPGQLAADCSDARSSITQASQLDESISPSSGHLGALERNHLFTCHLNQSSVGSSSTLTSSAGGGTCMSFGTGLACSLAEPASISPIGTGNVIAVAQAHDEHKSAALLGANGSLRKGVSFP